MNALQEILAGLERPTDLLPTPVVQEIDARGRFLTAAAALKFMHSGNATITLQGREKRFTYKISVPKIEGTNKPDYNSRIRFVALMNGPDNEKSFQYLGYLKAGVSGWVYNHGAKSKISYEAQSAKAFTWAHKKLARGEMPEALEVWHEGRCGRCGRKLTVPESVASGFGPECINHIH